MNDDANAILQREGADVLRGAFDRAATKQPREELLLAAWLTRELPPRDYLLGNVFCTTSRWLIFGDTGVGKTLFAGDMAGAMASGSAFLNWRDAAGLASCTSTAKCPPRPSRNGCS
jgi:hypothetical protein